MASLEDLPERDAVESNLSTSAEILPSKPFSTSLVSVTFGLKKLGMRTLRSLSEINRPAA